MGACGSTPASAKEPSDAASFAKAVENKPEYARSGAVNGQPTESYSLGACGISIRYAIVSQRGYNPDDLYEANQDAYGVVPDLKVPGSDEKSILIGVYDGNGGEGADVAQWVRKEAGPALESALVKSPDDYTAACKQAMLAINASLISPEAVDASYSGTTALTAWVHANKETGGATIHVSNVGDSRAVLGERRGNKIIANALSIDQTPYRKDERARLKAVRLSPAATHTS